MKKEFKVGDKVSDIRYGWGVVRFGWKIETDTPNSSYQINVSFDNDVDCCYSAGGSDFRSALVPLLSHEEYSLTPLNSAFPRVMEVRRNFDGDWRTRVVIAIKNNKAIAWNSAETLEEAELETGTVSWEQWREIKEPKEVTLTLKEVAEKLGLDENTVLKIIN